jgi:hypothetical protein
MPTSEADSLLDHALQAHQYRLRSVVSSNNDFGVPRKYGKFLIPTVLSKRWKNPRRKKLRLQHLEAIHHSFLLYQKAELKRTQSPDKKATHKTLIPLPNTQNL